MPRAVGAVVIAGALLAPMVGLARVPPGGGEVAPGVALWRAGGATVVAVEGRARPAATLEALRRAGVRRIDLVAATSGGPATLGALEALEHRWTVRRAWLPVDGETGPGTGGGPGDARRSPASTSPVGCASVTSRWPSGPTTITSRSKWRWPVWLPVGPV